MAAALTAPPTLTAQAGTAAPETTCARAPGVSEHRFRAMSTDVHLVVVGGEARHLDRAEAAIRRHEARWSRFLPGSELSQLNANPEHVVVVSADTYELVRHAIDAYHLTAGAFDPTVLASLMAAGYDRTLPAIEPGCAGHHEPAPSPAGIELFDELHAIRLPAGVGLDLGGIAKGATADAVAAGLLATGVEGCCVNIGGDLRVSGRSPDPEGWTVELDCPGSDEVRQVVLAEGAICTSTTVKRRWRAAGGAEHHLRDPATGAPLERGLQSVSVICARATQAEVLTKAALAAGAEGAAEVICGRDATGVLVDRKGAVIELAGFDAFRLRGRPTP
jgi:thiamine biosynthesis lipoprotein